MNEEIRTTAVKQGLEELLKTNNCRLEPRVILTDGNVKGELVILPNPEVVSGTISSTTADVATETASEVTPEPSASEENQVTPDNTQETPAV